MPKKKILICSRWLEIGGAERALLGLLYSMDYDKYSVDLYLSRHSGELMPFIPQGVNLLPEDKKAAAIAIPMVKAFKKGYLDIVFGRMIGKIATVLDKNGKALYNNIGIENSLKYTYRFVKSINPDVNYDLAISFLAPHHIVLKKVKAKKKIAWVHCDYSAIHINRKKEYKIWKKYDNIVAVSGECRDKFVQVFPELISKTIVIENINNVELIKKFAKEFDVDAEMNAPINILTIGRYGSTRNFEQIPFMCRKIINRGWDVKWCIIGFGNDAIEQEIKKRIKEFNVENNVILLGKKSNPYPYIEKCDIFVLPSSDEGKSVAVTEAQIFGKVVVITNYPTARSQLNDGVNGVIVPIDFEKCADKISELITNKDGMSKLSKNCLNEDFSNKNEIFKIYELIEEK